MQRDIAVPQLKPRIDTPLAPLLLNIPGLVCAAPSLVRVGHAGERIQHRIEIRANRQASVLEVIAGVDNELQSTRRQTLLQSVGKLRSTDPTTERDDVLHADCLSKQIFGQRPL